MVHSLVGRYIPVHVGTYGDDTIVCTSWLPDVLVPLSRGRERGHKLG